jgi:hypothetical protein
MDHSLAAASIERNLSLGEAKGSRLAQAAGRGVVYQSSTLRINLMWMSDVINVEGDEDVARGADREDIASAP